MKSSRFSWLFFAVLAFALSSKADDDQQRLLAVKLLYQEEKWDAVLREAQRANSQAPEFDYYAGMALSHLSKWAEAKAAFSRGIRRAPNDVRMLTERAGTEYKLQEFSAAKRDLLRARRLEPADAYVSEFLGTIFLLEGNLEAALKYFNSIDKPRLSHVSIVPEPKTKQKLLDRAIRFSPPGVLDRSSYLQTLSILQNLETFSQVRLVVAPTISSSSSDSDSYVAALHLNERNGWGSSFLDGAISLLRGLPYQTVYPTYYNLRGEALNFDALARWDPEKRRTAISISTPLLGQPKTRVSISFDQRDENWNLSQSFSGSSVSLSDLKLKRSAGAVQFHIIESPKWDVTSGMEFVSRTFRNVPSMRSAQSVSFFQSSRSLDAYLRATRLLLRIPEHRYSLDGSGEIRAGRDYGPGLGAFGKFRGELSSRWLPKARGDDYETMIRLRAGLTNGDVPLDELYQLGVERDNDLWLRGHSGIVDGRKGRAPLGRRYLLMNSELNKTVYQGSFFRLQLGPFFDTGAIADPTSNFGSRKWLFDTGIQARIRVLGSANVVLSYGRDLRNGSGVFYGTSFR